MKLWYHIWRIKSTVQGTEKGCREGRLALRGSRAAPWPSETSAPQRIIPLRLSRICKIRETAPSAAKRRSPFFPKAAHHMKPILISIMIVCSHIHTSILEHHHTLSCGKHRDILSQHALKTGKWRYLSVHSESYPQLVGLWIFLLFMMNHLTRISKKSRFGQKICTLYKTFLQESSITKSNIQRSSILPTGMWMIFTFVHSFSKGAKAGRSRVSWAFPQLPQPLLLLLSYIYLLLSILGLGSFA